MVSSQDEKVFRVLDFIRQKQADSLKRLLASVDIVTKEKIIGFGGETTVLKETQQVVILSMDVTFWLIIMSLFPTLS